MGKKRKSISTVKHSSRRGVVVTPASADNWNVLSNEDKVLRDDMAVAEAEAESAAAAIQQEERSRQKSGYFVTGCRPAAKPGIHCVANRGVPSHPTHESRDDDGTKPEPTEQAASRSTRCTIPRPVQ